MSEFQKSLLQAKLPKYRLDARGGGVSTTFSSAAAETFDRSLLQDVLYDTTEEARDEVAQQLEAGERLVDDDGKPLIFDKSQRNSNSMSSKGAKTDGNTAGTGVTNQGDSSSSETNKKDLAAWRLQIRAIFFPRAHILAQQQAKKGEAVRVLDQSTEWFEMLSLFLTVANIIVVAIDDPTMPESAPQKVAMDKFDTFFSLFYFLEMVIRIVSFGVWEFWADAFNRLDAVVVVFGLMSLVLKLTSDSLANITFVRALRVLRPLRTMTQFKQTRLTVASVIGSFRELLDVSVLFMVFFSVLFVLAVDPFRGILRNYCIMDSYFTTFNGAPSPTPIIDGADGTNNINNNDSTNSTTAATMTTSTTISPQQQRQDELLRNQTLDFYKRATAALQEDLIEASDPRNFLSIFGINESQDWYEFIFNTTTIFRDPMQYACQGPVDHYLGLAYTHSTSCADEKHCTMDEPTPGLGYDCPTGYTCSKINNPEYGFLGFDNILLSSLTTFVLLTTSYWVDIYHMMFNASDVLAAIYVIFTVIVGRYFVVSIIIAIVTDRFREKHRQQQLILHEQQAAAARSSKRIRVKSIFETSLEALEKYFDRLRNLEEVEIHHDFASSLEEDVLVRRTKRDWDNFRFVDEDLYDTQASMIRRSASMAAAASFDFGSKALKEAEEGQRKNNKNNNNNDNDASGTKQPQKSDSSSVSKISTSSSGPLRHYALDSDARRRRWFAREIVLQKRFLVARVFVSLVTLAYLATEYEGVEENARLDSIRFYMAIGIMCWWFLELLMRALSRRWLLLLTDFYFVVEVCCAFFLFLSLMANFGTKFGSLSEAFFLGRFSVFLSESYRITPLYRWIRIIIAAFRSSIVLIAIIILALFLLACTGMQVFGARWCGLESPKSLEENIHEIEAGTCDRPRSNFDSFGNAMIASFQMLTGDHWEQLMYHGMQSTWNRNSSHGAQVFFTAVTACCFVSAFVILNYLFANLFISILLNSRAVNEEELRRDAVRIQREVHYGKLLARRQLQLEAGLYDVAAVASALFNFNNYFRGVSTQSKKVFDVLFSDKVAGRVAFLRRYHVFATSHVLAVSLCTVGLIMANPITPPDITMHRAGLVLIHLSTGVFTLRLLLEVWVESYKMRLKKLQKRQRRRDDDLFDFEDDDDEEDAADDAVGRRKKNDDDDDDAPLREKYAVISYFARSSWHIFEFFLTSAGIVFGFLRIFLTTYNMGVFITSCILCFRPLCFMERARGVRTVLRDLSHMLRNLACILSLIISFYVFYSLLGVQLLRGRMNVCLTNRTIIQEANCTQAGDQWGPVQLNFDDLGAASYSLYAVATFSDWSDIFYQAANAGHTSFNSFLVNIYFLFFIIAGGLFAQSLVTMMLIDTFEVRRLGGTEKVSKQDQARAITQERFAVQQKLVARIVPREVSEMRRQAFIKRLGGGEAAVAAVASQEQQQNNNNSSSNNNNNPNNQTENKYERRNKAAQSLGQKGLSMTQSKGFRAFITMLIFLSFCVSASYRYPMSDFWSEFNYWADLVFTVVFTLEVVFYLTLQALCVDLPSNVKIYKRLPLRIINGWRVHFSSKWNWFDAIIVVLSIVGIVLERTAARFAWTKNLRALRALRLLRLVKNNPRIAEMVSRLGSAIKQLFYVTIIFAFFFVSFGLLGIRLFSHIKFDPPNLSIRVGFSDFVSSLFMMMKIATLNRWPATMIALSVEPPNCDPNIGECGTRIVARAFMISTTVIFGFVLSNMFVAVLVDAYMSKRLEGEVLSQIALTPKEIQDFADQFVTWPTMDPVFFTIPAEHVVPFLRSLRRLHQQRSLLDPDDEIDPRNSRIHPFALPVCDLKWRQPQWDLLAVQQLNLKEYSPGLIDYWSLINALCDLRFVRDVSSRHPNTGVVTTVKAGVLEKSKEKMLKRKFLLKVPARQQQLAEAKKKKKGSGKEKIDDELEDNVDEEDEEVNPYADDGSWDNPFEAQPRMLLEVYAITRLRNIMMTMPKWRGFMMEATDGSGGGNVAGNGGEGSISPTMGGGVAGVGGTDPTGGTATTSALEAVSSGDVEGSGLFQDGADLTEIELMQQVSAGHFRI